MTFPGLEMTILKFHDVQTLIKGALRHLCQICGKANTGVNSVDIATPFILFI